MNTAARMEHTGEKGNIQLSRDTAELLRAAGKEKWLVKRHKEIGSEYQKDVEETYWLSVGVERSVSISAMTTSTSDSDTREDISVGTNESAPSLGSAGGKLARLVDWNAETLLGLLRQIAAHRTSTKSVLSNTRPREQKYLSRKPTEDVQDIISFPADSDAPKSQCDKKGIQLPPVVVEQVSLLVSNIAKLHNDNQFHCFEHASHVTMSVSKLLSRIVDPDVDYSKEETMKASDTLHACTYAITSDPLTQFSCAFAAMIHAVDHSGIPNMQLVKEDASLSHYYSGKAIAEQHALDTGAIFTPKFWLSLFVSVIPHFCCESIAWKLLMGDDYRDLRDAIYCNDEELKRFRHLLVTMVVATDLADPDLQLHRNQRWSNAFGEDREGTTTAVAPTQHAINLQATLVLEHLLQASSVAHTMQHWQVYRKWSERRFKECYRAFQIGRSGEDPAESWYQEELNAFDLLVVRE